MSLLYSTDFDSTTVGTLPAGWVDIDSAGWAALAYNPISGLNAYGLNPLGAHNGNLTIYTGISAVADMDVQYTTKLRISDSSNGSNFPIVLRASIDCSSFYLINAQWWSGNLYIYKFTGGSFTVIAGPIAFSSYANGDVIKFRAQIQGTAIRAKTWLASDAEPGSWISTTDSSISAAGYAGIRSGVTDNPLTPDATVDDFSVRDFTATSISLTDTNIYKSPYGWRYTGAALNTNCATAYLRIGFTGTSISIYFGDAIDGNKVKVSVDGAPFVYYTIPTTGGVVSVSGLSSGSHNIVMYCSLVQQSGDLWVTPTSIVSVVSIIIDDGSTSIAPPAALGRNMMICGDSITAAQAGTGGESTYGYAFHLAQGLLSECGVRGFGGVGYTHINGTPDQVGYVVPHFTPGDDANSNWNKFDASNSLLSAGLFVPAPDYIVLDYGANDKFWHDTHPSEGTDAQVQASVAGVLVAYRGAAPTAKIFAVIPFGGFKSTAITAGFTQFQTATPDGNVFLIDLGVQPYLTYTSGATQESTDGAHPDIPTHARLAALLTAAIKSKIVGRGINGSGILGML